MSATPSTPASEAAHPAATGQTESGSGVPKKVAPGQTVCNERNEKNKLCNGHLKQVRTGGEVAEQHLRGDDVLFKCQSCGTLYMGPPMGHVRDPFKQQRFIERELMSILQAAGGTLPAFKRSERGTWVPADEAPAHAPAKPAPAKAAPAPSGETPEEKRARLEAQAAGQAATAASKPAAQAAKPAAQAASPASHAGTLPPLANMPPVPGETHEQKIARLTALVAAAKARKEAMEAAGETASTPAPQTRPTAATTSGTDSSAEADAHRPAAEAQAATGMASAAPLSPAAATASPAAGPEAVEDLAPDTLTATAPAAPKPKAAPAKGQGKRASFDTGPVPGETHEQKITRLQAVVAAAKERAESGG